MARRKFTSRMTMASLLFAGVVASLVAMYSFSAASLGGVFNAVFAEGSVRVETGLSYGPHRRHALDIYSPKDGAHDGPVVVFIYGGGWRSGERETYGFVGAAFASRGITTVIPDYRLFPEVMFPDFVTDAARAYGWVTDNIEGAGTTRPIVLIGHSAGAHIAGLMAVDRRYLSQGRNDIPAPAGFVGLAGPYSFDPTTFETTRDIFASVTDAGRARPTQLVTPDTPPTLVMHGLDDETVRVWNTRTFAQALDKVGVPVRKLEFEGIGHTGILLALSRPLRWRAPVLEEILSFIEGVAGQVSSKAS